MTDHLKCNLEPPEHQIPDEISVQTNTSPSDGTANDVRTAYEEDHENEKPVLLELGVTSRSKTTANELITVPYTADYPLDIQLSSVYDINASHSAYSTDPALLYNNPYVDGIPTTTHRLSTLLNSSNPSVLVSLNTVPYSTHIPQTVYAWSTSAPMTSITSTGFATKLETDIIPSPMYMTYPDAREHKIAKEINPLWKERVLQSEKDHKRTACDRERTRMRDMNRAFDLLRSKLPISKPNGKKYSKIESLRIAINYISHLQQTLNGSSDQDSELNLNSVEYVAELNLRKRSHSYRSENRRSSSKLHNLNESLTQWDDGYIPNGQEKWE